MQNITANNSGGLNVQNIISQFTGNNNAAGGLLDGLKGLFGK